MRRSLEAYVTEFTCDGGQSWEIGAIAWFPEQLLEDAKKLPFPWRITNVRIAPGSGPMTQNELDEKIRILHEFDTIFQTI